MSARAASSPAGSSMRIESRRDAARTAPPDADPRRCVGLFALVMATGLSMNAAFNWLTNPWGLYAPRLVPARVVDERYRKCALLRLDQPPPEQLVLGTSRTMRFEPAVLQARTGLRTFNAGIPGASPIDCLALYRYAAETVRAPVRSVILGVEARFFTGRERNYPAVAGNPELCRYLPEGKEALADAAPLEWLLSPAQAADGCASLAHAFGWGRGAEQEAWIRLDPDGFERRSDEDDWRERHAPGAQRKSPEIPLDPLDPVAFRDLATLLDLLQRRRVRTLVVATPMLDAARQCWRRTGAGEREKEALGHVRALASRYGARYVDFSTVASFAGDPAEFYDVVHPTVVTTRKMIDALFPGGPTHLSGRR